MYLAQYTGKGIRIAVIDSGVHATHPHIVRSASPFPPDGLRADTDALLHGGVSGGLAIREDGSVSDDYVDRLGHGTAVTAAIREKAPGAEILAIRVFWRTLATNGATLVRAIDEAAGFGAGLINLSLGTSDPQHEPVLSAAVARAARRGSIIVAALENDDVRWLPGSLEGVVPVQLDWACDRGMYRVLRVDGRAVIAASGYPRDVPGVPRAQNLKGISFAVANATGFVARALEALGTSSGARLPTVFHTLEAAAPDQAPG